MSLKMRFCSCSGPSPHGNRSCPVTESDPRRCERGRRCEIRNIFLEAAELRQSYGIFQPRVPRRCRGVKLPAGDGDIDLGDNGRQERSSDRRRVPRARSYHLAQKLGTLPAYYPGSPFLFCELDRKGFNLHDKAGRKRFEQYRPVDRTFRFSR